jgi:hypothetical protein
VDFDYNHALILSTAPGFVASSVFLLLYVLVDRPAWRDRYAWLLFGLGFLAMTGFGVPTAVALFGPNIIVNINFWQWVVSIGIRAFGSVFMCWLLWVYLTPNRARLRLARYTPGREASDAPDDG